MTRPRAFTIAAVLMFLFSLIGIATQLPNLALGLAAETQYNGEGPPFVLGLLSFATGILGLVAAYGVWKVQQWAVVLSIVLCALNILMSLLALLFAPFLALKLLSGLGLVWAAAIIVLLLRPQPTVGTAAGQAR